MGVYRRSLSDECKRIRIRHLLYLFTISPQCGKRTPDKTQNILHKVNHMFNKKIDIIND